LIGQAIAWLIDRPQSAGGEARPDDRQGGGVMMSVMAGGVWVAAAIAGFDSFAAALAIVGYAWLLALGDRAVPRLKLAGQALAAIGVATIKWLLVDLVAGRISGGWGSDQLGYAVLVNPMVAMGLLLAGSMVAICLLRRSSLRVAAARSVVDPAG